MNNWFTVYINFKASQLCRVYTDSIVATKDLTFMGTALCMAFLCTVCTCILAVSLAVITREVYRGAVCIIPRSTKQITVLGYWALARLCVC